MGFLYEKIIRPGLFMLEAERAHNLATIGLKTLSHLGPITEGFRVFNQVKGKAPIHLFGLNFPNAVGLAAGMDKNAEFPRGAAALGFGHVEVGAVTPLRQPGNPRPRMFRYPKQSALVNRMGFNNHGADAIRDRLARRYPKRKRRTPLGINLGKGKTTDLEDAIEDYLITFKKLAEQADYFSINVSSPNTPGLRHLQKREFLRPLLKELQNANEERVRRLGMPRIPLLVKMSPDVDFRLLDEFLEAILETNCAGVIATNTTTNRGQKGSGDFENGGLSGQPLRLPATQVINYIYRATEGKLPIIGVGGIDDPVSAGEKMDAGASLVQLYTGLVYRGPFVAKRIAKALSAQSHSWF
ncbi:MAG: dihydroorotate dehydrogenase (quinone) [Opitutae bacterium]|nr:dihydroorotate dehydrogenase (quinone) [Opitutae bacterium]